MSNKVYYAENGNVRMEADTIIKNGQSSKSHKSRVNFLRIVRFCLLVAVGAITFSACKDDNNGEIEYPNGGGAKQNAYVYINPLILVTNEVDMQTIANEFKVLNKDTVFIVATQYWDVEDFKSMEILIQKYIMPLFTVNPQKTWGQGTIDPQSIKEVDKKYLESRKFIVQPEEVVK